MPGTATDAPARGRERLRLIGLALASTVVAAAVALLVAGSLDGAHDGDRDDATDAADIELTPVESPELLGEDPSGEPVPAVAFTYFDGREGSLADYAGRPLVVNFFASWCGPCEAELPGFAEVHRELGDDVAFLGMNLNDSLELGRETAEEAGVGFDLATDPESGELFAAFGGSVMPYTVFVSPDQEVVAVHRGELSVTELEEIVRDRLLS